MNRTRMFAGVVLVSMLGSPAAAGTETTGLAVGFSAGTTGAGIELTKALSPTFNGRLAYRGWSLDKDLSAENNNGIEGDEVQYTGDLKLAYGFAMLDWYPWRNGFHFTGGPTFNRTKITADAVCDHPRGCELGSDGVMELDGPVGDVLNPILTPVLDPVLNPVIDQLNLRPRVLPGNRVDGTVRFSGMAPYFGLGWGNPLKNPGLGYRFELGVIFQGTPDVDLHFTGPCAGNGTSPCHTAIEEEEAELQRDADDLKYFPVLNATVTYRF